MAIGEVVLWRPWAVDAAGSFVVLKMMSAGCGLVMGWEVSVEPDIDSSLVDAGEAA